MPLFTANPFEQDVGECGARRAVCKEKVGGGPGTWKPRRRAKGRHRSRWRGATSVRLLPARRWATEQDCSRHPEQELGKSLGRWRLKLQIQTSCFLPSSLTPVPLGKKKCSSGHLVCCRGQSRTRHLDLPGLSRIGSRKAHIYALVVAVSVFIDCFEGAARARLRG